MKLFSIGIYYATPGRKPVLKKKAQNVSSFGYFQRSGVQEFLNFTSSLLVERSEPGQRKTVKEQEYRCHVFIRSDNLGGVLIADQEYPQRVAFTFLTKVLDQYTTEFPNGAGRWASTSGSHSWPALDSLLEKYQNPREADAMTKVQADLDETKIILYDTIEAVLQRGEKLDDLVKKSDDLSLASKSFYKEARKANSCCVIL
ncbi:synaptobrevin homolog YKT6-like [Oscarella lobularis]|uniref:synaptobrevin homolog YKT6-like n=1 Tax=Oscarella lobularis TaxID=121494 RepID=UPI0033136758